MALDLGAVARRPLPLDPVTLDLPEGRASIDARLRDCVAPPILEYLAFLLRPSAAMPGWGVLDGYEDAARFAGIRPGSVLSEIRQMAKRGTIEVVDLGDMQYRIRLTAAGWAKLEAQGLTN